MIAAIYPAHEFGAGVGAIFKVEPQMNLIVDSFFQRERLTCLGVRERC